MRIMGYQVPDGYSRVQINMNVMATLGSVPTFGFGCQGNPSADLVSNVADWCNASFSAFLGSDWSVANVVAYNDNTLFEQIVGVQGSETANMLPPNSCVLVSLITGVRGRANRGRMYIPGILREGDVDDLGNIGTTKLDDIIDLLSDLGNAVDLTSGLPFTILHSTALAPTDVTSAGPQPVIATQRRRLRG